MREYFTYGSVRGAAGDGGPYRVRVAADVALYSPEGTTSIVPKGRHR